MVYIPIHPLSLRPWKYHNNNNNNNNSNSTTNNTHCFDSTGWKRGAFTLKNSPSNTIQSVLLRNMQSFWESDLTMARTEHLSKEAR